MHGRAARQYADVYANYRLKSRWSISWGAAGIQALVVPPSFGSPTFKVLTTDGDLIDLPNQGDPLR
jgi:hypothetical protein